MVRGFLLSCAPAPRSPCCYRHIQKFGLQLAMSVHQCWVVISTVHSPILAFRFCMDCCKPNVRIFPSGPYSSNRLSCNFQGTRSCILPSRRQLCSRRWWRRCSDIRYLCLGEGRGVESSVKGHEHGVAPVLMCLVVDRFEVGKEVKYMLHILAAVAAGVCSTRPMRTREMSLSSSEWCVRLVERDCKIQNLPWPPSSSGRPR